MTTEKNEVRELAKRRIILLRKVEFLNAGELGKRTQDELKEVEQKLKNLVNGNL